MAKSHFGKCALCGEEKELTFEHIPPRAAFNTKPARPVHLMSILSQKNKYPWDTKGLPYDNLQKGMGKYSLCKDCNNLTGTYYGEEYKKLAYLAARVISDSKTSHHSSVRFKCIYPLRFIKQVCSMFCSVEPDNRNLDELRHFVLDKDATSIDTARYKISMYFTDSELIKFTGMNVVVKIGSSKPILVSELTVPPMGFLLYYSIDANTMFEGVDITPLSNFGYDDAIDVDIPVDIREMHNAFPLDYRSKDEIIQAINEAEKIKERILPHNNDDGGTDAPYKCEVHPDNA